MKAFFMPYHRNAVIRIIKAENKKSLTDLICSNIIGQGFLIG